MSRTSKKTENIDTEVNAVEELGQEVQEVQEQSVEPEPEVSKKIEDIMKLYPQYEEMWITSEGFVHPAGVPEYLTKNAKLYTNKFFNK